MRGPAPGPVPATDRGRRLGLLGLAGLAVATAPLAAPGARLIPATAGGSPDWLLGVYGDGLGVTPIAYYGFLWLAFVSYLAILRGAPALGRVMWISIGVAIAAFALAPPLLSQDVFSYISYARLGTEHGLNPYVHVPADVPSDAAFRYVGWKDDVSAYGPVFTLGTYAIGPAPVSVALWVLKAVAALSVAGLAAFCAKLAPLRGVDPRRAAALVALNPLVLVHVVGGAHNDALMMLGLLAGVGGILVMREGSGGAALLAAVSVKVSAAFVGPFALLGAQRRGRLIAGALVAALIVAGVNVAVFGSHALDAVGLAGENQARVSKYSIPNQVAELTGVGVDGIRATALAIYAIVVVGLLAWVLRGGDWIRAAAWAGMGLLLATAWLLPWYVIWVLPLAALARSRNLTLLVLAFTAFELVNRVPI